MELAKRVSHAWFIISWQWALWTNVCSSASESCDILNFYNSKLVQAKSLFWGSLIMCESIVCWSIASKTKGSLACVLKHHQSKQFIHLQKLFLVFFAKARTSVTIARAWKPFSKTFKLLTSTHISVTVKCVLQFSGSILETRICWVITDYM